MAKRMWRPFQPTYVPGTYTRIGLSTLETPDLAKEYSRVRREAQERLRSFQRSRDPELRQAAVVAEKAGVYLNRAQIKAAAAAVSDDPKEQAKAARAMMEDLLIDAYRFVSAKTSSVSGYRDVQDKQISSLQAAGYEFVNRGNLKQFGEFMDYFRSRKDSKAYGSDTIADTFNQAARQKMDPKELEKHFKFYAQQIQGGATKLNKFQRKNAKKSKRRR